MRPRVHTRYALSSVISSILLSAAVLAVGGVVWSYSNGASGVIASQYYDDSMDLVQQLQERFIVEHVNNSEARTSITVYIYNYGDADVELDVYADSNSASVNTDPDNPLQIQKHASGNVTLTFPTEFMSGERIGIQVYSRRQNNVYYTYIAK